MAQTVWKGYLTFGLISVPIRLFAAARHEHVSFHMIHAACGTRVRQQLFCPHDDRVVDRSEIAKGYEVSKDTYIIVEPDELKKIAPPSERSMDIIQFVKFQDVDPLYFDASYYALPDEAGQKPYTLLVETLEKSGYAALAKVAMHQHEYLVIVRPRAGGLTLHTLYYPNELNQLAEYGQPAKVEIRPQEVELAQRLIENLAGPFEPGMFEDEYQKRVRDLIEAKREGKEIVAPKQPKLAPVVDLMEALQKSLAAAGGRKPPAAAEELRPHKRAPKKRAAG